MEVVGQMALKAVKRLRIQELKPGMVFGKTVLNDKGQVIMDQGKVILQEGSLITQEIIDRLRNWNICVADVQVSVPAKNETPANKNPASILALSAEMLEWMSGSNGLSVIMDRLAQGLGRIYPFSNIFISLIEGVPARWWVVASSGTFRLPDLPLEQKFRAEEYLGGQPVIIGELSAHKVPPVLARADMLSMCGIPIVAEGNTVGVIELYSRDIDVFSANDIMEIALCARKAGVAVRCTRISEALQQTTEERNLLYEIMGHVASGLTPVQLLSKIAENISDYFAAHAVAAFTVQRLPHLNKTTEVMVRNFSRTDMDHLKVLFSERWPPGFSSEESENGSKVIDRLRPFSVNFSGGKSIYVLPLFSRDLLQGILVLLWEYDRRVDFHRHMDDMLRIVADQTAMGLERHHLYAGVERIGFTDELTGLSNRRMFNYLIEREINRSRRYGRPLTLVMIDIDHFKKVNDTWGHPIGDLVLRELGALMRENFRRLDVPVRYGGEEFAAILPETNLEEAINFAERFRVIVENYSFMNGRERIPVTISIGIATIGSSPVAEEVDSDTLLQRADRALYQAKQSGRNRIAAGRSS